MNCFQMSHNYRLVDQIESKGPGRGLEKLRKTALLSPVNSDKNKKTFSNRRIYHVIRHFDDLLICDITFTDMVFNCSRN